MARVSVQQRAFTDPRFRIAGNRLDPLHQAPSDIIEHALGLYLSMRVWDFAQERGTDVIPGTMVESLYVGLCEAMIEAELLEPAGRGKVRIRGWADSDGGWLERVKLAKRAGGLARSAGSQRSETGRFLPAESSRRPAELVQQPPAPSSALTLTLAPALKSSQKTTLAQVAPEDGSTLSVSVGGNGNGNGSKTHTTPTRVVGSDRTAWEALFERWWSEGPPPRKVAKAAALRAWKKHFVNSALQESHYASILALTKKRWQEWATRPPDRRPYPASFLNAEEFV